MKKQDGYIVSTMLLVIISVFIIWLFSMAKKEQALQQILNNWTADCYQLGGEVKFSGQNTVDCFVNDVPCRVVGYEKFESVNPIQYFRNLKNCTDVK